MSGMQNLVTAGIPSMENKIKELVEELKEARSMLKYLQSNCTHPGGLVSAGHDSHYSYEKCEVCGHSEQY
jgi:hypothetical protein